MATIPIMNGFGPGVTNREIDGQPMSHPACAEGIRPVSGSISPRLNQFCTIETETKSLVFNHYAYVSTQQLRFKEIYYGYKNAVKSWNALQSVEKFPVLLKDYFPWVKDDARRCAGRASTPHNHGSVKSILWIRGDSIGDNVMAASMLTHIRTKYPHAKITVFCQNHIAELYEFSPFVDASNQL